MRLELKKISELLAAPYNPRTATEKENENLKQSIDKFGVVQPVILNEKTGYIVGGHFRVRVLKQLGYKETYCVILSLDDKEEKELNIRLNANNGSWDYDGLANIYDAQELNEWGLDVWQEPKEFKELTELCPCCGK